MNHSHEDDPEYVSRRSFDTTVERLEGRINRAERLVEDLERKLGYKAEERHDHRGTYADERHYH